jgi:hypothetical protein
LIIDTVGAAHVNNCIRFDSVPVRGAQLALKKGCDKVVLATNNKLKTTHN